MLKAWRVLFALILFLMLAVTTWASLDENIILGFQWVWSRPWGVATLADAYCGFLTFYAWVFYKETSWGPRALWFVLIMVFGNIAMAAYMLRQLSRLGDTATPADLLLRKAA